MTVSRVCYTTRETIKRAISINGADQDARVDRINQAISSDAENDTRTWFIPRTYEVLEPWPQYFPGIGYRFWLLAHLCSVSALVTPANGPQTITLDPSEYFLEPQDSGPPYRHIDINLATGAAFQSGLTYQRSVSITGQWCYSIQTQPGGTLVGTITDSATTLVCSNASLIGVGDSLLIGTEQILVADRSYIDSTADTTAGIDAQLTTQTIPVTSGALVNQGETILIDAEEMYVRSVVSNSLIVDRAFNGSTLASHLTSANVFIGRQLSVLRGQGQSQANVGGTTPASHSTGAAILVYQPPNDVQNTILAKIIATIEQEIAGYGRLVGTGEGARQYSEGAIEKRWNSMVRKYKRGRFVAL